MFEMNTNAFTSYGSRLSKAMAALPRAHRVAANEGSGFLHGEMTRAAREAGWDAQGAIGVGWTGAHPAIHVTNNAAGNRVFDNEFGTHEQGPNPVLRTTARAAAGAANDLYTNRFWQEMGLM